MVRKTKYKHNKIVTLPQDNTKEVSKDEWNDSHDEVGMTGHGAVSTLTISSGAITPVSDMHVIDGEGAANDDLTTIINTESEEFDEIRLFAGAQTITIKSGVVNVFTLSGIDETLSPNVSKLFVRRGTDWYETGGSGSGSKLTRKFTVAEIWNAISGLSTEEIHVIHANMTSVMTGFLKVIVDSVLVKTFASEIEDDSIVISPSSSVDVIAGGEFDVSTAVFSQSFSVAGQETQPRGVAFNTDGSKMYIIGNEEDEVFEYDLSTGFDVSTAVFSQSFSVTTEDDTPYDVTFNTNGTKMYIAGDQNNIVLEYDLSTGFDVSTAVFSQSFSVAGQETQPRGVAFNTDGSKMYIIGINSDSVHEYDLSTGFDVSTAVFSQSFSVSAQDTFPNGITFNTDGSKMYIIGSDSNSVYEYDLSTGFDISSAVFSKRFLFCCTSIDTASVIGITNSTILLNDDNFLFNVSLTGTFSIKVLNEDNFLLITSVMIIDSNKVRF